MLDSTPDTKTAADLGIAQEVYDALLSVATDLETGKLKHVDIAEARHAGTHGNAFNMVEWHYQSRPGTSCGTVCCIGGWVDLKLGYVPDQHHDDFCGGGTVDDESDPLEDLFCPHDVEDWNSITPSQAASAIRHYLQTGAIDWPFAISTG